MTAGSAGLLVNIEDVCKSAPRKARRQRKPTVTVVHSRRASHQK